jgi:hypothetical protein
MGVSMLIENTRTAQDLREQAQRCRTNTGAAILCGIAGWLDKRPVIEGDLEPHEFVDLWAKSNEEEPCTR